MWKHIEVYCNEPFGSLNVKKTLRHVKRIRNGTGDWTYAGYRIVKKKWRPKLGDTRFLGEESGSMYTYGHRGIRPNGMLTTRIYEMWFIENYAPEKDVAYRGKPWYGMPYINLKSAIFQINIERRELFLLCQALESERENKFS